MINIILHSEVSDTKHKENLDYYQKDHEKKNYLFGNQWSIFNL
jgi:hypothetical protein